VITLPPIGPRISGNRRVIMGFGHGGMGPLGLGHLQLFQMPDEYFASSGHRPVAKRCSSMAGIS